MASCKGSGEALETSSMVLGNEIRGAAAAASQPVEGKEIRTSPIVCNLCETDLATYYCQTCSRNICNICFVGHGRHTDTRNHNVISIGNTFNTVYCIVHPAKNITYFCNTCKIFMCDDCDHEKHKTHNCNKIDKCRQELKDLCHDLSKQLQIPYDAITHMEANIGNISDDYKNQCNIVKKELDERKSKVLNIVGTVFDENSDKVTKEKDEIKKKYTDTKLSVADFKSKFVQTVHSIPTVVFSGDLNMIINCIQTMQQQTEEARLLQKELEGISKRPILKITAENYWLHITTDITKHYMGVTNNSGSKPPDQCEVLEKYKRPVIQKHEAKCSQLEKEVDSLKYDNQALSDKNKKQEAECTEFKKQVDSLKKDLTDKNKKQEAECTEFKKQVDSLKLSNKDLTDKNKMIEKKAADIESKNQILTEKKKMIEDKYTSLEKKVADIESKNRSLTGEKKTIEYKCTLLEKKVADIESKNQSLTGEKKIFNMAGTKKSELTLGNHIVNLMDQLGQGAFAVIYRGHHKSSAKELIAAKRVSLKDGQLKTVMREIKALDRLYHHDHIIRLIDYHYHEQDLWLIMEFCEKGDLQQYSKKNQLTIDFTIKIMLQITSAIKFLHDNKVIHRDLKPGNILLRDEKDKLMAKVTDFGCSRIGDKSKSDEEWLLSSDVGTFAYKAPELFDDKIKYTMTVDTFALGLMLLALVLRCENTKIKELFPLSVKSLERGKKRTVGQEMFDAHDDQRPFPEIVRIRDTDDNKVKESKELVKKMCAFTANDRMPLKDVLYTLSRLSEEESVDETI